MSYGDHSSGLRSTGACITHCEQIDLSTIYRLNVEQRLNLIEILYRTGYLPWGREQVTREIKENKKMVRILGGTDPYLMAWLKMGLENASRGHRARPDDDDGLADSA